MPEDWTARLLPGAAEGIADYEVLSEQRSCVLRAAHGPDPPSTSTIAHLVRSWDGAEVEVGVDHTTYLAVVDDFDRTSDWVSFTCNSNEAAQSLASHVWVAP